MGREVEVILHGEPVATLTEGRHGIVSLAFRAAYRGALDRPVLSQRFEDDLERTYRSKRGELPAFFANLVPEHGSRLRELLEESAGVGPGDDLAFLAAVGSDLPGAVEIRSDREIAARPARRNRPPEDESQMGFHFSLAGVQMKFSVLRDADRLTLPARDQRGSWILKLDSRQFPGIPENEVSMMRWARATGFEVPDVDLIDGTRLPAKLAVHAPEGSRALLVRRYDRRGDERVHQEDFAQVTGLLPARKYDGSFEKLAMLVGHVVGAGAIEEMVRRLVFSLASGNNDAHLKNWSLVYPDRVRPALSPLYDQVATVAWREPARRVALKLAGERDFGRMDRDRFQSFAERIHVAPKDVMRWADETLETAAAAWDAIADDVPLLPDHRDRLMRHWTQVPLLRDSPLASRSTAPTRRAPRRGDR